MFPRDAERPEGWGGWGFRHARRVAFLARLGGRIGRRLKGRAPCCESLRCFGEELAERGLERKARILAQVLSTPQHVVASAWEKYYFAYDTAAAVVACGVPLLDADFFNRLRSSANFAQTAF